MEPNACTSSGFNCINTEGSYTCSCPDNGYYFDDDIEDCRGNYQCMCLFCFFLAI